MSFIRDNLKMLEELSVQSRAIEEQKSITLPYLKQVVTDALYLHESAPLEAVDFIYPVGDNGDFAVVYQWNTDSYTEDLIISAEDLTAERPGIAYRLRAEATRQSRRGEELRRELEAARAKVLEIEARLGE